PLPISVDDFARLAVFPVLGRLFEAKANLKRRGAGDEDGPLPGADLFGELFEVLFGPDEDTIGGAQGVGPLIVEAGEGGGGAPAGGGLGNREADEGIGARADEGGEQLDGGLRGRAVRGRG